MNTMKNRTPNLQKLQKICRAIIIPLIVAVFNVLLVIFPQQILQGSKEGLNLWFNNVLPSLLPFIIGTNLLIGLGVVSFLGTLLEPVMQPLFGVSGCGGYALITGMTSGYPMGLKTVANLREVNQLTQTEAQRLAGFVNNGGPLFIIGVVGLGMFNCEAAGYFILTAHYSASIITGLLLKYYKKTKSVPIKEQNNLFATAVKNMKTSIRNDGRGFGKILSDSIKNSLETIAMVGGFIILFSVVVKIFEITNLSHGIASMLGLSGSEDTVKGLLVGITEITNGAKLISQPGLTRESLVLCAAVIAFGGFSIHAQSVSFIRNTDIKTSGYLLCKFITAVITATVGWLIYPLFDFKTQTVSALAGSVPGLADKYSFSLVSFLSVMLFLLCFAIVMWILGLRKRTR